MNAFLLTFDPSTVLRQEMIDCVNRLDGVRNWLAFMPTTLVVVSEFSAHELTVALNLKRPGMRFVMTRCDPMSTDGQLPKEVWDFINWPAPVPTRPVHAFSEAGSKVQLPDLFG